MRRSTSLCITLGLFIALASVHAGCSSDVSVEPGQSAGQGGGDSSATASSAGGATSTTSGTTSSTSGTGGASTVAAGSSSSSGAGGATQHGDCETDADCPDGPCVALTPGGYTICISIPDEATSCAMGEANECCTSADCPAGSSCYEAADVQFCGGAYPIYNECLADECESDADCQGAVPSICAPAGAFGNPKRACLAAYCQTDADCSAKPGGACLLVGGNPCCSHPVPDGLACVYPGGCATNAQCPDGACAIDPMTGTGVCGPAGPGCPP